MNAEMEEIRRQEVDIEALIAGAPETASVGEGVCLPKLEDGTGRYRTIYMDPPWRYRDKGCAGAAEKHYPTMSVPELAALPISALGHPEGYLVWMWTTWPMTRDLTPHRLLDAWGLRWTVEIVWHKPGLGIGRWLRPATELLVVAAPPSAVPVAEALQEIIPDHVTLPRLRHSQKPDQFRRLVASLSPGPRLEMFARASAPGWDRWGNEAPGATVGSA